MTNDEPPFHIDYNPFELSGMTAHDTLQLAAQTLWALAAQGVRPARKAAQHIQWMIDQRGCEDFDPAVEGGRMTELMDVIMFG